jgi:hypothetical protein
MDARDVGGALLRTLPASAQLMRTADGTSERHAPPDGSTHGATTGALVLVRQFAPPDVQKDSDRVSASDAPAALEVWRQEATSVSVPGPATVPTAPGSRPEGGKSSNAGGDGDVDELVDKVTRKLLRQLAIERERRGVNPCL